MWLIKPPLRTVWVCTDTLISTWCPVTSHDSQYSGAQPEQTSYQPSKKNNKYWDTRGSRMKVKVYVYGIFWVVSCSCGCLGLNQSINQSINLPFFFSINELSKTQRFSIYNYIKHRKGANSHYTIFVIFARKMTRIDSKNICWLIFCRSTN